MAYSVRYIVAALVLLGLLTGNATAAPLRAGVAKADITDRAAGPVNDPLYTKALVLTDGETTLAIVTVDAVSLGEIGYISNDYLPTVRQRIEQELGIPPSNVVINTSHCHGVVRSDVDELTVRAVTEAFRNMVPVTAGAGTGHEDRIMENRRLKLKSGKVVDVRRAYSLPPDDEVAEVGPVDPEIGLLRFDREDGRILAVLYTFSVHPIHGVPSLGNTADMIGFSSKVLEDSLDEGTMALFLQGTAGDINPIHYKHTDHALDAELLGNMLGLSTLRAVKKIRTREVGPLKVINEKLDLPRANSTKRITALESERMRLTKSLQGTTLSLKTFIPLIVKYKLSSEFPSYYSHGYLHEEMLGREDLTTLDASNQDAIKLYIGNVHVMEELTRINTNLVLLRKHLATFKTAGGRPLQVELVGVRVGDFVLTTFPGELTVPIGLNIKSKSPHDLTFVAGYTNGYIYYAPTTEQLLNPGAAQEDSDTLVAPGWQEIYEKKAAEILSRL
jgi:hypothetical protein